MGRGSRPTRRWENDRQRKKKDRAKKKAVHGEGHIRSTVDYVREGRKNNFD